jgi:hypothetical protein
MGVRHRHLIWVQHRAVPVNGLRRRSERPNGGNSAPLEAKRTLSPETKKTNTPHFHSIISCIANPLSSLN